MTGLGIGAGGLGVTALGIVADAWGVETAMRIISVLPLLPWSIVLMLPSGAKTREATAPLELQPASVGSD